MRYEIENNYIKILVDVIGAELKSVVGKKNGTQFLYDGKGKHWDYSSPVLFPFVGRLKEGRFKLNGNSYEMPIHGFARFYEFEAVRLNAAAVSFILKSSNETRKLYPFDFILEITYKVADNRIEVSYRVKNTGRDDMFFGLGAHPGFLCPIEKNEAFEDYYLEFDEPEASRAMKVTEEGLFSRETGEFLLNKSRIDLNHRLFENDALVFAGLKSEGVCLKSKNHKKYIRVDFGGFDYLGIWTVPGAPFLCVEPWISHGDFEDFTGDLPQKPGVIKTRPQEIYSRSLSVSVFE